MTIIDKALRQIVEFDASNKEHRAHLLRFLRTNTWKDCPVRYELPNYDGISLPYEMMRRTIEYYASKEKV